MLDDGTLHEKYADIKGSYLHVFSKYKFIFYVYILLSFVGIPSS